MNTIKLRNFVHQCSSRVGFSISKSFSPHQSFFGHQVSFTRTPRVSGEAAYAELAQLIESQIALSKTKRKLLDVGMGDGRLFRWIMRDAYDIEYFGLDMGESNDFKNLNVPNSLDNSAHIYRMPFSDLIVKDKFDYVFLSHFIEHSNNILGVLDKLSEVVSVNGAVIFEWPLPHRKMIGGHVTLLTPALLAYNLAKAGFGLKRSKGKICGKYATLAFVNYQFLPQNNLICDTGELEQLVDYLPECVHEGSDIWAEWDNM